MSGWEETTLGEIAEYVTEKAPIADVKPESYFSTDNMLPNRGGVCIAATIPSYGKVTRICCNDVLVSNIRPYFKKIWRVRDKGTCSADVLCFRAKAGIDSRFLFQLLSADSFFDYMVAGAKGTKMPRGDKQHILEYPVPLPPLPTQRRIAAVLSALDDKIELNNRVNANLEAQAQALFRSWFVDFEPWGGEMPSGWRIRSLSDIAEFYPGYSYKSSELVESDMAMATIKNYCRGGGFKLDGYKEIKPLKTPKPTQVVDVFDTLVAHTDVTQNADIVGNAELILSKGRFKEIIASMDLVKVSPKQGVSKFLLGAILKSPAFKEHCLQFVNGTTVLHLSKQALPKYEVAFPDDCRSVQPLADALECLFRKMALNIEASDRLASLRDALLPKLMSGEIDAEKVEEGLADSPTCRLGEHQVARSPSRQVEAGPRG